MARAEDVVDIQLNHAKTQIHSFGDLGPLPWPPGAVRDPPLFRHLGVVLSPAAAQATQRRAILSAAARAAQAMRNHVCNARKRAILANAFVWGRAAYCLPHLPWPQASLTSIDQTLARAVWGAPRRSVARATLSLPPSAGGLGLVSPWLARLRARWRHFEFITRDPHTAPRMLRWLSPHLPWVFPYAGLPPTRPLTPLLREMVTDIRCLHRLVGLNNAASMDARHLADALVAATAVPPRPRRRLPDLVGHPSLQRALRAPVREAARSLYIKLHLDIVPVAGWLLHRRMVPVQQAFCRFCCSSIETITHLFLRCSFFAALRERVNIDLHPHALGDPAELLFPPFRDARRYAFLLAFLWAVWSARMSDLPHASVRARLLPVYASAGPGRDGDALCIPRG